MSDADGCLTENVRRSHQTRDKDKDKKDKECKIPWLQNSNAVEHTGEFEAVLGAVNLI